jgi:hypothetical protein
MEGKFSGMATQRRQDMRPLCVTIPDGVEFADLCLRRDVDDGLLRFNMAPIQAICETSALTSPKSWVARSRS